MRINLLNRWRLWKIADLKYDKKEIVLLSFRIGWDELNIIIHLTLFNFQIGIIFHRKVKKGGY